MKKYYDKELPVKVQVFYGGRRAGVTYREIEKLKEELNELKIDYSMVVTENKKLKEENKMLREGWDDMFHSWETQVNRVGKAIRYIEDELIPYGDEWHWDDGAIREYVISLSKKLKGEE